MTHPGDDASPLQHRLLQQVDAIVLRWQRMLLEAGGSHARGLVPQTVLADEMRSLLGRWLQQLAAPAGDGFGSDPAHPLAAALREASQVRALRGYSPEESLQYLQLGRDALLAALAEQAAPAADQQDAAQRIGSLVDRCVLLVAGAFIETRESMLRRQGESLREVSTPVITLWDSMLLLPLVGVVDSVRAQQISERLLQAVSEQEAAVTLIDVTGVPVMDTGVARHILKTVAAAEMLGTRVILTGISPGTAQTMVKLGIDMSRVPTRSSLKAGVALAMTMTRRQVVPLPGAATGDTPAAG